MGSIRGSYLVLYNVIQSVGWAVVLYQLLAHLASNGTLYDAYSAAGRTAGATVATHRQASLFW